MVHHIGTVKSEYSPYCCCCCCCCTWDVDVGNLLVCWTLWWITVLLNIWDSQELLLVMSSMTLRQSQVLPGSVSCWWLLLEVVSSSLLGCAAGGGDSPAAADCRLATPLRDQSRATTRLMLQILYHNIPPPQGGALLVPISILLVVVFTGNWRRLEFWCNTNWCILLKYPLKCINVFTLF